MALRALLLDFDGTLADSLAAMRRVYERFVTDLGGVPTSDEFEALNGPPLRQIVRHLCLAHQQRSDCEADLRSYVSLIAEELSRIRPASGADLLLERAKANGFWCVVVTSGEADLVTAWLRTAGLDKHFDLIVSGGDVKDGKPSPAPYQFALQRLGLRPEEALAIEDSESGVTSATSAGIATLRLGGAAPAGSETACITRLEEALAYLEQGGQ